jgi:serine/threonine protein kinase, bacterial
MALAPGSFFAGYTVIRLLGSGGMGEVYLAQHPRLPRRDALKVLPEALTADAQYRARFIREADLAATLFHPHIVGVHDRGEFDGRLWIAMDYVEGTDAAKMMADRYPDGLPADEVIAIVAAIAAALDHAHQRGLLHRDVKPANILISDPDDGQRRILLADFGIARELAEPNGLTATNLTVGTVAYAAPEQLIGQPLDGRADQYALAATAFHLLCGAPLFQNSNPVAVIGQHLNVRAPKLSTRRPELANLNQAFDTALAKEPKDRFDCCRDFAEALGQCRPTVPEAAIAPPPASVQTVQVRWPRRRSMLVGAGVAALVIAVLLVAIGAWTVVRDRTNTKRVSEQGSSAPPTSVAGARPAAAAAPLDGVYRMDFDFTQQSLNGRDVPRNYKDTSWWAFRSACPKAGCVATFTKLDDDNHDLASTRNGGLTGLFKFGESSDIAQSTGPRWQSMPIQGWVQCKATTDMEASETERSIVILKPQPDGTLAGVQVSGIQTSECGQKGAGIVVPVTATRVGDVPPSVTVADPLAAAGTETPPLPAPPGPTGTVTLGSACDVAAKFAYDLAANQRVVCNGTSWVKPPDTNGTHTIGLPCDSPATMSTSTDGYLITCDGGGHWTRYGY